VERDPAKSVLQVGLILSKKDILREQFERPLPDQEAVAQCQYRLIAPTSSRLLGGSQKKRLGRASGIATHSRTHCLSN